MNGGVTVLCLSINTMFSLLLSQNTTCQTERLDYISSTSLVTFFFGMVLTAYFLAKHETLDHFSSSVKANEAHSHFNCNKCVCVSCFLSVVSVHNTMGE